MKRLFYAKIIFCKQILSLLLLLLLLFITFELQSHKRRRRVNKGEIKEVDVTLGNGNEVL